MYHQLNIPVAGCQKCLWPLQIPYNEGNYKTGRQTAKISYICKIFEKHISKAPPPRVLKGDLSSEEV